MKNVDEARADLRVAMGTAGAELRSDIACLNPAERQAIDAGLDAVDREVGEACRRVLKDWETLDAEARLAALLVLANALAERVT